MNLTDLPRRKSARQRHLVPVPHQPATAGFSDPAPVQVDGQRLARIEQDMATVAVDLAWMRRALAAHGIGEGVDYDNGYGAAGWADEPAAPAWHGDPDATLTGECSAADVTMPDRRAQMARPYAPEPHAEPVPVITDIGALPLFRDAVRARFARSEPHHGCPQADAIKLSGTLAWPVRYAVLYQHRTAAVPEPELGIDELFGPRVTARSAS